MATSRTRFDRRETAYTESFSIGKQFLFGACGLLGSTLAALLCSLAAGERRRAAMQRRELGETGLEVAAVGFGASPLGEAFGAIDPAEGERAVHYAVERGINLFDVSPYYGMTLAETRLGAALKGRRDHVILQTKCGRYGAAEFDFSPKKVRAGLEESLQRLQTDHVDVLLAHDVEFGDLARIVDETIPAMRALQKEGKARWIGVSGYPLGALQRVMREVKLDVVLSYCRYNLLQTDLATTLLPEAQGAGVGVINASPLHMGLLGGRPSPEWHPADEEVRAAGEEFAEVCALYGLSAAAVAMKFCLELQGVAATLVGIASRLQVDDALAAASLVVPAELGRRIEEILAPVRGRVWVSGRSENNV